jgi:hypothetical protein
VDSFFTATGSSPPPECPDDIAGHDARLEGPEGVSPLPEELVEALAGLLAQALVNDIRQYPDLQEVTHLPASLPAPTEELVAPPEGTAAPASLSVIAFPQPDPQLGGRPMRRQTRAFTLLRNLARPLRLRLIMDAEGYPAIPGRYGRVEWFNGRELAVYCGHPRLFAKIWAIPGVRRHQTGDDEMRAILPPEALEQVAGVIRARRQRPAASAAHLQRVV